MASRLENDVIKYPKTLFCVWGAGPDKPKRFVAFVIPAVKDIFWAFYNGIR